MTRRRLVNSLVALLLVLAFVVPTALAEPGSEDIKALYKGENAMAQLKALTDIGPRVAGGPGELAAANYIADQMRGYGLDVAVQEFPITYFEDFGSTLNVVGGAALTPSTIQFSPSGDITAQIAACGFGSPADIAACAPSGKIALISRGAGITFGSKTTNAAAGGALAAIIYNNTVGAINWTLGSITSIPSVGIPQAEGGQLISLLAGGPVTVRLVVNTNAYDGVSRNVIGTLKGTQPDQGIVYVGGHYDSVSAGPGANDDGTGVAAVLEAARVLSTKGHQTKATVKFIAFGAEETGLNGSYEYVVANEEEVATKGLGMVNLDMVGVGNLYRLGNIGDGGPSLLDFTRGKATAMGITWTPFVAGSNSDHTYFEAVGVPAVFLQQWPDPYYHTPDDTLDKISAEALEKNGELATAVVYDWAKNPVLREKKAARLQKVHVYHDRVLTTD